MHKYYPNSLIIKIILLIISFSFFSCKDEQVLLSKYLSVAETEYEQISIQMGEAYWNLYSDEAQADLETPKKRYAELFTNDTLNHFIDEWYNKRNLIENDTLRKRVEVWHNILTAAKVNYSEENLTIQNELEFWLAEDDSAEGKPTQDELTLMTIQLMKLRNQKAQELGYGNYGDLMLEVTGISTKWLNDFVKIIDNRTLEPYKKLISDYKSSDSTAEFNNTEASIFMRKYYLNQIVPNLSGDSIKIAMKMALKDIGIDYDGLPVRFIENEMPPGIGGQGIAVQIPNDIRIALMPGMDLSTWMHELGHGLHAMFTNIKSPILKGYEWSLGSACGGYAEGMAETSAKFFNNINVVKKIEDNQDLDLDKKINNMNTYRSAYLRYWLPIIMYEVEFYKNIDQDPAELRRQLTQKYRLLDNPPERIGSIANMANVSYPFYLQNYLIAEVLSWQVHETLRENFGESYASNPGVGEFLKKHFYQDGELIHWEKRLLNATGKELDVDGYLTHFGL